MTQVPQLFEHKPISNAVKWASFILVGLPIAFILNDIFIFEVGQVFFSPMKLVLLIGGFTLLKYTHPELLVRSNISSPVLTLFFLYVIIQSISIFYAHNLTILQKVNYFLFNLATLVIVYGLSRLMLKMGSQYFIYTFSKAIKTIFYLSLLFSTVQLLLEDQIIRNIGDFPNNLRDYVTGFNRERLNLCEFLTLGLALIILQNPNQYLKKLLLVFWVFIIIFATNSFTGMLGFTLIFLALPRLKPQYLLSIFILIVLTNLFIWPVVRTNLFTEAELERREYRFQGYIKNYEIDNWRYLSTVTLISEVIKNPTFFGKGYKENESFLIDTQLTYYLIKHRRDYAEVKPISPHSFFSILYDQGIFGFFIFVIMIAALIIFCYRFYVFRNTDQHFYLVSRMTIILLGLTTLRFLFYYHSIHKWHYLVAFIFANTTYHLMRNRPKKTQIIA